MVLGPETKGVVSSTMTATDRSAATFQNRNHFKRHVDPATESKRVHKMSTPWLVAEEDKKSRTRHVKYDNKNDGNNKKNRTEVAPTIPNSHATTDQNATKKQVQKPLRSNASTNANTLSAPQPIMSLSIPDSPAMTDQNATKKQVEKSLRSNASANANTLAAPQPIMSMSPTRYDESLTRELPPFFHGSASCDSTEEKASIDSSDKSTVTSMETTIDRDLNLRQCDENKNQNTSIRYENHNDEPPTFTNISVASTRSEQMVRTRESFERQHPEFRRKGEDRSSNRGQFNYKKPVDLEKPRFEPKRQMDADYDRELLMGLEMQRDLNRMSLNCGTPGSKGRRSSSRIERKQPREKSTGFSFLPSSMSCFNPTSQLDGFETAEEGSYNTNFESSSAQSKPTPNNFCSGASSALLCDIKDDEPFWKYYDDIQPTHQLTHPVKTNADIKSHESREYQDSRSEQHSGEFSFVGEPKMSFDGEKSDQFGRRMPNGITRNHDSEKIHVFENTRNHIRRNEERDPILNSRTPSESERRHAQNLAIYDDPTHHGRSLSTSRTVSIRNGEARDVSLGEEYISIGGNDKETRSPYESLMNYPTQSRCDHGQEVQPSTEDLLNQMRQAVQKASAQLDSRIKMKATMETECSDESSYVSNHPEQERTRPQQAVLLSDFEKRTANEFHPGMTRDKYDFK